MIDQSFLFLPRLGRKGEKNIWIQGISAWREFLQTEDVKGIGRARKLLYNRKILEMQTALDGDDLSYIGKVWPQTEMWRFYTRYREECCFLDIEINGAGQVIVVGISDYYTTWQFVKGVNLSKREIDGVLSRYKVVITFNGGAFDLPKLRKKLDVVFEGLHIDLKPLCVNLGLVGGLKEIERILKLGRPSHLQGNPVNLWRAFWASGDKEYLDLLLAYNGEDCENLKMVMERVWKSMINCSN